jgi:hypothetical protein
MLLVLNDQNNIHRSFVSPARYGERLPLVYR